jgi:hypothetical protein
MQNQPDMIESDDSAKRCSYAQDEGIQVSSARNTPRERQNGLIDFV